MDTVCLPVDRDNFILHIFSAFFLGHALAPIKNRAAVKIAFIGCVMIASGNIIHIIKRIFGLYFSSSHMPCTGPQLRLHHLALTQVFGIRGSIGQIHVAKRLDRDVRNPWVVVKIALKIIDKFCTKLTDLDIGRIRKLLADAGIGVACGGEFKTEIPFH